MAHSFFFFGGLSIPVSQAILAHCFSYNMTWGATKKEVERSNFFKEIPKIFKRFWFSWLVAWTLVFIMIILSTPAVPIQWRIDGSAWAVIFPLAVVAGGHILFPVRLVCLYPARCFSDLFADRPQPLADGILILNTTLTYGHFAAQYTLFIPYYTSLRTILYLYMLFERTTVIIPPCLLNAGRSF